VAIEQGNTMLNKRASLGLRVVTTIASAPSHRTVTAETLASLSGVSLSYIEGILKDAREFGLIQATRGPGGGYQSVASMRGLSVWDVVECFNLPKKSSPNAHSSPEWVGTNLIAEKAFQFEKEFLQKFPVSHLVPDWFDAAASKQSKSMAMNFKPLPKKVKPVAPNSVFDLSNFLNLQVA
jgi:Rrf2 family iron-sulfur cluster assembly transcriptional regulator